MAGSQQLVEQVINRLGVVRFSTRRDIARELSAHLEDIGDEECSPGLTGDGAAAAVRERFGTPEEIARDFADAYRLERWTIYAVAVLGLWAVSFLGVWATFISLKAVICATLGRPLLTAFSHLGLQFTNLSSPSLGYLGARAAERHFRKRQFVKAAGLNAFLIALVLTLTFHFAQPGHRTWPAVAFLCASLARLLQGLGGKMLPAAAIGALPVAVWYWHGAPFTLVPGPGQAGLVAWVAMTLSFLIVASFAGKFEQWLHRKVCADL
jgi:hypothetical protein